MFKKPKAVARAAGPASGGFGSASIGNGNAAEKEFMDQEDDDEDDWLTQPGPPAGAKRVCLQPPSQIALGLGRPPPAPPTRAAGPTFGSFQYTGNRAGAVGAGAGPVGAGPGPPRLPPGRAPQQQGNMLGQGPLVVNAFGQRQPQQ